MKQVTIIATPHSNLGSIDNPRRAFLRVNEYLKKEGREPLFNVRLVGNTEEIQLNNGIYTLHPDAQIGNITKTDLVIIPAFEGDIQQGVKQSRDFIPWIIEQYHHGAEVASLCVGAFLLASTGLLDGKKCSTHWRAAHDFEQSFPEVTLLTDKIITDEQGLYTSGGAFSSANLILYLIEKYAGRKAAIHSSKIFQIDLDRSSQSPFIMFEGQKDHEDKEVKQTQKYIEDNFTKKIKVKNLAENVAISRRTLERRFKKATDNTIIEYMQRVKVEAAKRDLETGRNNVNEVMYKVGYSDTKSFRNLFRRITGLTPIDYRNKYNRQPAIA